MEWDLCSSAPCVPFYHYITFDNSMPKSSCQKSRKTRITEKVLVIQSSNIVHYDQHMQKPACADFQAFSNTFSLYKLTIFYFFVRGIQQTAKNVIFCWFCLGKTHWNGLSGAYLGFKACWIQLHRFWISMVSSSQNLRRQVV